VACEDLPHRPTPAGDQYSPETPVDNPNGVGPGTTSQMPDAGGPPYLAVSAALLLVVAAMAGRGVLRRWDEGYFGAGPERW
jgi:hypothetical protein